MEWLHEAAAETYLPLLRMLNRLETDGIGFHANLVLSPILLEQLVHPTFVAEFPRYLSRKMVAAREDESFFEQSGESRYAELARMWHSFFAEALRDFEALNADLVSGFRRYRDAGMLDLLTSCATHSYLPLLGTDESVRAQVRLAVETHERHLGEQPRGIWSPECGYRPAGIWSYPTTNADGSEIAPPFERVGLEQVFADAKLQFFYVDAHLIDAARLVPSTADESSAHDQKRSATGDFQDGQDRQLYQPYLVAGADDVTSPVTAFPRDPRSGLQVWSSEVGYPAEPAYLDFHKKRWPGGHRYWRVTDAHGSLDQKAPYEPAQATERVRSHAAHFAHLLWQTLSPTFTDAVPAILSAPFDAELFGHWWFEGPQWLEAVARTLHNYDVGVQLSSSATYLDQFPTSEVLSLEEGSWGAAGDHRVWLNPETSWTWSHLYPAERLVRELATNGGWHTDAPRQRVLQQMCRELLLLESSDWQSLITTGGARDYAEARFLTHHDQFRQLQAMWESVVATGGMEPEQEERLAEIEQRDGIFRELDPGLWATHQADGDPALWTARAPADRHPATSPSGISLRRVPDGLA